MMKSVKNAAVLVLILLIGQIIVLVSAKTKYEKYPSSVSEERESTRAKAKNNSLWTAWGIVFFIVGGIILGVVFYYAMILYPFVCKKERKYDRFELSAV